jgi:tRNA A37 methylthiotransferase MiaB
MKVGVLGCMAERLKDNSWKEKIVDLVVGPDAYKDLQTFCRSRRGRDAINVILSKDETYGDISRSIDEQWNYRWFQSRVVVIICCFLRGAYPRT